MIYKCQCCNKSYKTEKGFNNHICENKRRYDSLINTNHFTYWLIFKTVYKISINKDIEKEKINFISSAQYKAFIKFVNWCNDIQVLDINSYFEYLKKYNIPLKLWCNDGFYKKYLSEYIKNEPLANAIERSLTSLKIYDVSIETISQNRLFLLLLSGQISVKYLNSIGYPYRQILDVGQLKELETLL